MRVVDICPLGPIVHVLVFVNNCKLLVNVTHKCSVCLVLEICEYGSLSDVLRGPGDGTLNRPPLNLSYSDRMYLALGCARGLQALHSYSPMLCHRDIKSFNFLSKFLCLLCFLRTRNSICMCAAFCS